MPAVKSALQGWARIGFEIGNQMGTEKPREEAFWREYNAQYGTIWNPKVMALIPSADRAWFWFRVGYRRWKR